MGVFDITILFQALHVWFRLGGSALPFSGSHNDRNINVSAFPPILHVLIAT